MRASGTSALSAVALAAIATSCGGEAGPSERASPKRTVTVNLGRGAEPPQQRSTAPRVPGGRSCDGAREATNERNLRAAEIAIRCLTNAARRNHGLPTLGFDERLARAAANRSKAMADANYFGHDGPGNSTVRSAARATGWVPDDSSWLLGENIGWAEGRITPARMMRSWLDSPRHRRNLLASHFRQTGVGAVAAVPKQNARSGATFTQIFGATGPDARRAQTG